MSKFVTFPLIAPSSRTYNPGEFPQTVFEAQNGATAVIRFGSKRVNSSLRLGFTALTDAEVVEIFQHYEEVNSEWYWVNFATTPGGVSGIDDNELKRYIRESDWGLRWRYSRPPEITATFKGRHDMTCEFTGFLDAE